MNAPLPTPTPRVLVATHVSAHPGRTAAEIAKATKLSESRVANELNALRTEGLIDCERAGTPAALRYRAVVPTSDLMAAAAGAGCADTIDLPDSIKPGTRKAQIWHALRAGAAALARANVPEMMTFTHRELRRMEAA